MDAIDLAEEGGPYTEDDVRRALQSMSLEIVGKARQEAGDGAELPPEVQQQLDALAGLSSPEGVKKILADLNGG